MTRMRRKNKYALQDLTIMQRKFCEYLVINEGRTTHKDAALHAGYSPNRAKQEAYELLQLPHIQAYLTERMNEINKSFVVTRANFIRHQMKLSDKLVEAGKVEKAAAFEAMIGKAQGIFIDRREILTRDLTAEDKMKRAEELKAKAGNMQRINKLIAGKKLN